mmetsp:Transcript_7432/g.11261  ORF Transcript_7432/g.11261 Transcript_7432/m.11261 type:complete len:137 (+) Transcript_7432:521-931(+)
MRYQTIIKKLWRKKNTKLIKDIQKIRLYKLLGLKTITKFNKPLRLDKARMFGYKNNKHYFVLVVKIKRSSNKRKARKGKVFGKISSQGCKKRKRNINSKEKALLYIKRYSKDIKIKNIYWLNQDRRFKFFEALCYN